MRKTKGERSETENRGIEESVERLAHRFYRKSLGSCSFAGMTAA